MHFGIQKKTNEQLIYAFRHTEIILMSKWQ